MVGVAEILATAIEFERFGKEYYMRFYELVGDPKAKALMKGLAHDEEEHAAMLSKELETHLDELTDRVIREAIHEDITEAPEAGATKALPASTPPRDQGASAAGSTEGAKTGSPT